MHLLQNKYHYGAGGGVSLGSLRTLQEKFSEPLFAVTVVFQFTMMVTELHLFQQVQLCRVYTYKCVYLYAHTRSKQKTKKGLAINFFFLTFVGYFFFAVSVNQFRFV